MTITVVADAKKDFDGWLKKRKEYLTSSDFYSWIGDTPGWWSDTRDTVLAEKRTDTPKEFDHEVQVSVEHGSFDEENILRKFAVEVGATVEPRNTLTVNDRWPHLAASIDGLLLDIEPSRGAYKFSQDREAMVDTALHLAQLRVVHEGCPLITEVKKSTSKGWSAGKVSEWYVPQVQGQLHILDLPAAVIMAETILRKGHRLFWNLTANVIIRDEEFAGVMDRLDAEFARALDSAPEVC